MKAWVKVLLGGLAGVGLGGVVACLGKKHNNDDDYVDCDVNDDYDSDSVEEAE